MKCMETRACRLCGSPSTFYHTDRRRAYFQCGTCRLVFAGQEAFLSLAEEKSRYDLHENNPEDAGYRRFLGRMCAPIIHRLAKGSHGLDFGCGPGPTLSLMFAERGYPMAVYDPFYAPDMAALETEYDFVTATEVVEHLREPWETLNQMWHCVKPGGLLGIMTKRVKDRDAFASWHYKNDETHICFFSEKTFTWLAAQWRTEALFLGPDVTLFRVPAEGHCGKPPLRRGRC